MLKSSFEHYAKLVSEKKMLEAIDKYYDDNIIQYENQQEPLIGKTLLRAKEEAVSENMISLDVEIFNTKIDVKKGIVKGHMNFIFESIELGKKRLNEAFTQKWENGKIKEIRFIYNTIEDLN